MKKSETVVVKGTGIFAGAYRNGAPGDGDTVLTHACFETDTTVGRLRREAGQALCNRKLNACAFEDATMFEDATKIDCPKCLAIVARIRAMLVHASPAFVKKGVE